MDLTWDNVTAPSFCILDMEHWGTAVTGYAAAWLYLSALAVPEAAAGIRDALAGMLDTPSGRYAQLVAAALILRNLTHQPDPGGLAARLHQHTDTLLRITTRFAKEAPHGSQAHRQPLPRRVRRREPRPHRRHQIGTNKYAELRDAPGAPVPAWLSDHARTAWGLDVTGAPVSGTVMVRPETAYGYARASYELNLGCNYDCEHCYLGEKTFACMDWPDRKRLLDVMADAGVLWLSSPAGSR